MSDLMKFNPMPFLEQYGSIDNISKSLCVSRKTVATAFFRKKINHQLFMKLNNSLNPEIRKKYYGEVPYESK